MTLSRKDQAKMKFLNSPEGRHLKAALESRDISVKQVHISDTVLPDDFVFDGPMVVDGKFCKTVGEYKSALSKQGYDPRT